MFYFGYVVPRYQFMAISFFSLFWVFNSYPLDKREFSFHTVMYKLIEMDVNVMDWSALLTYIAKLLYCTANVTFLFKKTIPVKTFFFLYQF